MRCVIIETPKNTVAVSLDGKNDTDRIIKQYSPDIIVCGGELKPSANDALSCIYCCDVTTALSQTVYINGKTYKNFKTTAEYGNITIYI